MFTTLDQDNDGLLSRREFRTVTRSAVTADGKTDGAQGLKERRHFDQVDTDHDGSISLAEFMAASGNGVMPSDMQTPDSVASATIAHFDQDNDGRLGPEELEVLLQMSHGVELAKLDVDGDGYVTHEELMSAYAETQSTK